MPSSPRNWSFRKRGCGVCGRIDILRPHGKKSTIHVCKGKKSARKAKSSRKKSSRKKSARKAKSARK